MADKDHDDESPLNEDTVAELEAVRKGRPRRFVLISKGMTVISLVVYNSRKGSLQKFLKQARDSGQGKVTFGVVRGRGEKLNFVLARDDGFDREPLKPIDLKEFLATADIKVKPVFEIVDTHDVLLDEDDPLHQRFLSLQTRALKACDDHPDKVTAINTLCRQIGGYLDANQDAKATDKIDDLEGLLEDLDKAARNSSGESTRDTSKDSDTQRQAAALKRLLAEAQAECADVLAADPPEATQIRAILSFALERADEEQFDKAEAALKRLAPLLKSAKPMPLAPVWTDVTKKVTGQVAELQSVLRRYRNPALDKIADAAQAEILSDTHDTVAKAVDAFDRAAGARRAKARDVLDKVLDAYERDLAKNQLIPRCDANPFDVKMSLAETLRDAVAKIRAGMVR